MSKPVHFNNGTLTIEDDHITWELPDAQVRCVSLGELNYLKKEQDFAVPVHKIEHINKHLRLTWNLPDGYQPLSSVYEEPEWFKLKIAKSFMEIARVFEEEKNIVTIFEPLNFFVDASHHVKTLFYTNPLHLPCQGDEEPDILLQIKKMLALLLTSISQKELGKIGSENSIKLSGKNEQELLSKLTLAETVEDIKHIIDTEYNRFLSMLDERELEVQKNIKTKQKTLLFMFTGFLVVLVFWFLSYTNAKDLQGDVKDLEVVVDQQESAIDNTIEEYNSYLAVYEAYHEGELEKALGAIEKISNDKNVISKSLYIELLVQSGRAQEVIVQEPEQTNAILAKLLELDRKEDILKLDSENPYIQFEQAVLGSDDEALLKISTELKEPSERQVKLIYEAYLRNDLNLAYQYAQENDYIPGQILALETMTQELTKKVAELDEEDDKEAIDALEAEIESSLAEIEELKK